MIRWHKTIIMLVVLIAAPAVHGEVYKWVDDRGITHFSDTPPPQDVRSETVPLRHLAQPDPEAEKQLNDLLKTQKESEQAQQTKAEDDKQKAEKKAANDEECRKAHDNLATYQNYPGNRILVTDPDGSRRRSTEEERQSHIAQLQEWIKQNCE